MLGNNITKKDYILRMCVIFLAALSPLMCLFLVGYESSLSQYWETPMQPLFVFANTTTSYYLITIKNWKSSAVLLILLTAFSVEYYNSIHNIFAVVFFIITAISLWKANHFKFCFWTYLTALLMVPYSMLYAEIIEITSLCMFHLLTLNKAYRIQKKMVKLNQNQHQA